MEDIVAVVKWEAPFYGKVRRVGNTTEGGVWNDAEIVGGGAELRGIETRAAPQNLFELVVGIGVIGRLAEETEGELVDESGPDDTRPFSGSAPAVRMVRLD